MPRIDEVIGGGAMSGLLKSGLTQLSGDQHVIFNLYRKYVNPIDGQIYWTRVQQGSQGATTAVTGGLASQVINSGRAVQVAPGGLGGLDIVRGKIFNPATAADQGLMTKMEPIFVSLTGPASHYADGWSTEVLPGESFDIPAAPAQGAWVSSASRGHKFTVLLEKTIAPLSGQPIQISQGGSLHYATVTNQDEDNVTDTNTVIFTSKGEVKPFNEIGPFEMYVGERDNIRFAFSSRGNYYENADLYHYVGIALQSYNEPAVIDNPIGWAPDVIVNSSIPIWLTFPGYQPPYPGLVCPCPVYPSYLIPDNVKLPYAAVHVEETRALAATPFRGHRLEHDQLTCDRVKVTLYGASARLGADFMDFALQFISDTGKMGLMGDMPILYDDHQTQVEFRILTQKKTIDYQVSYLQSVARDMARQIISAATAQLWDVTTGQPIVEKVASAID